MRKSEQTLLNSKILQDVDDFVVAIDFVPKSKTPPKKRLNHCQAWVQEFGFCSVLWSYNTAVAYYDPFNMTLYDVLRAVYGYTATSAQHIAKFRNLCNPAHVLTYREV